MVSEKKAFKGPTNEELYRFLQEGKSIGFSDNWDFTRTLFYNLKSVQEEIDCIEFGRVDQKTLKGFEEFNQERTEILAKYKDNPDTARIMIDMLQYKEEHREFLDKVKAANESFEKILKQPAKVNFKKFGDQDVLKKSKLSGGKLFGIREMIDL